MTKLTPYSILVDNVRLDNYAYLITSRNGWDITPGLTGDNIRISGRDGEIWRAKDYAPSRMVLDIYVSGRDENGAIPAGKTERSQFQANLDALLTIFTKRSGLIKVDKELIEAEAGTIRYNYAEVGAVIAPDFLDSTSAQMTVELIFPDPLWRDIPVTTSNLITSTNATINLTGFNGITGPITDASIIVTGPITNPQISIDSNNWIKYTGTVAAGSKWRIDCTTFRSEVGTGLLHDLLGTGTNVIASTTFSPGPRLFQIPPNGGTPWVGVTGSSISASTTNLSIKASPRYVA